MKLEESYDKGCCDECDAYDYVWELQTKNDEYATLRLCKGCLMKLLHLIVER